MDAGLAAVLGATVGAVGTGGAGIVAALLARSQARSQLHAEHARIIREPRRAAYVAFTEVALKDHNRLSEIVNLLETSATHPNYGEAGLETARQQHEAVRANSPERDHRYAQVVVEGPRTVTDQATTHRVAFADFVSESLDCLHQFERSGNCPPDAIRSVQEKRSECYGSILDFLYAAQRAIGADGINQPPE
ncbi:hypothetical protein [Streptomyces sp. NPDC007940]|uniref:hypothetical protein n=1 Tax=Streptomyces sp. NPDC007940 TaxID=3364796 RepID=UPI000F512B66